MSSASPMPSALPDSVGTSTPHAATAAPAAEQGLRAVPPGQHITVRVPATSANLGPGYDSLGLALDLHDSIDVETTDDGAYVVAVQGEGAAELPLDRSHLIVRTIEETWALLGFRGTGLRLTAANVIPHGRGLGSSASAIVSGVVAANALVPAGFRLDDAALLQRCAELEGHPDNVAPALAGGLSVSWQEGGDASGRFRSVRPAVHPDIVPVIAVPDYQLSTESARGLLPADVPHADAAANSARAALLIHALTAAPPLLLEGSRDYLHQSHRAPAMAPSAALIADLRGQGFAAVVSGAGPTVLVLAGSASAAAAAADAVAAHAAKTAENGVSWRVLRLGVEPEGAKVIVHPRY